MVATKIQEVTSKGLDWAYNSSSNDSKGIPGFSAKKETDSYWSYASNSFYVMYDKAQFNLANAMTSIYRDSSAPAPTASATVAADENTSKKLSPSPNANPEVYKRRSSHSLKYPELAMFLENPFSSVRGLHHRPSSVSAVRSLLLHVNHSTNVADKESPQLLQEKQISDTPSIPENKQIELEQTESADSGCLSSRFSRSNVSSSEQASQLAEGTIRALRDFELTEAVELHYALRFWSTRWERPILSWLEAGPLVWFSAGSYNHQSVGQKVSQLQAVLARRCAAIGDLQQHLLRAGWQEGVAQWGVLGQGAQFAPTGGDGTMDDNSSHSQDIFSRKVQQGIVEVDATAITSTTAVTRGRNQYIREIHCGRAGVPVRNIRGGKIVKDNPALAAWSIDAMRLVRDQLYGAGSSELELPYTENWLDEREHFRERSRLFSNGSVVVLDTDPSESSDTPHDGPKLNSRLPLWASRVSGGEGESEGESSPEGPIEVSDLSLMALEVSELLVAMEEVMQIQRIRRLDKLKPPSLLRRRWYVVAVGFPCATYVWFKVLKGKGLQLGKLALDNIINFYQEHVSVPLKAVYNELFAKDTHETISDRKARTEAIESCKKMIKSWLDETFPEMQENERKARADKMDMSLIEQKKEESIKKIYEINSVVRMSLIEVQFIKKELMNALVAMDEVMSSNEINMNLAAVTPAVLAVYGAKYVFRVLFYALLKLGRSREEVYASFRQVILDIERLLLMRDNPPSAPPPLRWAESQQPRHLVVSGSRLAEGGPCVLSPEDLGMLMLLIHECRLLLWRERTRFSSHIIRNISEDLAELAGERGAVSVQQQLGIISRMCRTYPFLKVVSTGVDFSQMIVTPSS
mmetsp:Transcript_14644/g.22880  ORF Transcript_14644/g.22880 Transcript_14644/m.22880 type:complete len:862 (-) Transcript_14644:1428-4013(-)